GDFEVPPLSADPDAYWAAILRILREHRGRPIPGLLPHENMMLFDGMAHLIGGTPLHTYAPTVDFGRVLANLPRFRLALFERFNESVGALLRELEIPVTLDEATNYAGRENPAASANHDRYYGAPPELRELVRALNENDVRLYEIAATG